MTDEIRTPYVAADCIIRYRGGIVLVNRTFPPLGWAIPGGMVDYGETVEHAAIREAKEETGLDVEIEYLLTVLSDPKRDPRMHCVTVVLVCNGKGEIKTSNETKEVKVFSLDKIPKLVLGHDKAIEEYRKH